MLERSNPAILQASPPAPHAPAPEKMLSLAAGLAILARHRLLFALVFGPVVLLGVAYAALAPPRYGATAVILIDTRTKAPWQPVTAASAAIESANVDSQVEVLRSEGVIREVVTSLNLLADPEFAPVPSRLGAWGRAVLAEEFGIETRNRALDPVGQAIAIVEKGLGVKRLGLSYVIQIDMKAGSAERAAEIANAVTTVYIARQVETAQVGERLVGAWLERRAGALRDEARGAERAVADRQLRKRLSDIEGRVLGEPQLAELGSQLILARAQRTEAGARLDRARASARSGLEGAATADVLRNEVVMRLRTQHHDIRRREAELANRFGSGNAAAADLAAEKAALEGAIAEETGRITRAYEGDYEIARIREAALQESLDGASAQMAKAAQESFDVKELESTAQSTRALAEGFGRRLAEFAPQASHLTSEARVISRALPPRERSEPKLGLTLGAAVALGAFAGFGAAALRDRARRGLRSARELEAETGLRCLASLPCLPGPAGRRRRGRARLDAPTLRHVLDAPVSRFAEAVGAVRVGARLHVDSRPAQVVAVVSAGPREGRSLVAANLAHLCARAGTRTLLIDGDLRSRGLTERLGPAPHPGLTDVLAGAAALSDAILRDGRSGLAILPAGTTRVLDPLDLLSSTALRDLLEEAARDRDVVILDLPPILPTADVLALSPAIDGYLVVTRFDETAPGAVVEALDRIPGLRERALGAVLNGSDPARSRNPATAPVASEPPHPPAILPVAKDDP